MRLLGYGDSLTSPMKPVNSVLCHCCTAAVLVSSRVRTQVSCLTNEPHLFSYDAFSDYAGTEPPRERPLEASVAVGEGYSESKWIAEKLLKVASERNLVRGIVVRIGQQTGGKNGAWKPTEWFPAIVTASAVLGCLPAGQGVNAFSRIVCKGTTLTETA